MASPFSRSFAQNTASNASYGAMLMSPPLGSLHYLASSTTDANRNFDLHSAHLNVQSGLRTVVFMTSASSPAGLRQWRSNFCLQAAVLRMHSVSTKASAGNDHLEKNIIEGTHDVILFQVVVSSAKQSSPNSVTTMAERSKNVQHRKNNVRGQVVERKHGGTGGTL